MVSEKYDTGTEPSPADPLLTHNKLPTLPLLGVLLVICGWLGLVLAGGGDYQRQSVQWPTDSGQTLRGDLWLPQQSELQKPLKRAGVVLVHGVMSSRLQPETAARTLASNGLVVLNLDLRGYGESDSGPDTAEAHRDDVLSALGFLRAQPGVASQKIALVGHSMGATAVVDAAAADGHVQGVFALGMHGEGQAQWITGLYDNLHPPGLYRPEQQVSISPTANHQTEWVDLTLLNQLGQRLSGRDSQAGALPELLRAWSSMLIALGFIAVMASLLRPLQNYARLGIVSAGIAGLLGCGYFNWLDPGLSAVSVIVLLGAYLGAGLSGRLLRQLGLILLLLVISRELAALLRSLPWQSLESIVWLPVYLWQSLCYYPAAIAMGLRQGLFMASQTRLEPAWPLLALLAAEWLFPAWWLKMGGRMKMPEQRTRPALAVLALGLVLLTGLIWTRLQQGYLEAEGLQQLTRVLVGEVPTVAFFLAGLWWLRRRQRHARPPEQTEAQI